MIDNFDQILQEIVSFESPEEFYFLQIIRRCKDNNIGPNNQFVKAYSVYSKRDLEDKRARIMDLCASLNARAYIHPSPRNDQDITLMMLEELAKIARTKQFSNARNLWASMCGRYIPPGPKRRWVIDIDNKVDGFPFGRTTEIINMLYDIRPVGVKIRSIIPTKNGIHVITTPFDLQHLLALFEENRFPFIDIHKNNPTLLYCP